MAPHSSTLAWKIPWTEEPGRLQSMGSVVKNLPASAGDMGSIPGLRRSPGGGDSTLLQYSCLASPMDRRAQQATVHWVCLRVGHNLETKQESLNGKCFICGCNKASRKYCT